MPLVLPLLAILAWVAAALFRRHARLAQSARIEAYCAEQGWAFSEEDPYGLVDRWTGPPFGRGYWRRATNVVTTRVEGRAVVAFDYSFLVQQGRYARLYRYHVVALGMPCALPALYVGPEDVLTRLGSSLGIGDIELESEDFNRAYRVHCPSPKFAHDVLTPRTMEALLAMGGVEFRFEDTDALSWGTGLLDPAEIPARVHVLRTVLAGIPSFVWHERGVDGFPGVRGET